MTRMLSLVLTGALFCVSASFMLPAEGRANSAPLCMDQGGKLVVLQPGSGSAGNAEAFPCPASASPASNSGSSGSSSNNSTASGTPQDAPDNNPITGIMNSIAGLQSMHDNALAIHAADVQRDAVLTAMIQQDVPIVDAYLGSASIVLSAFSSPFGLPTPAGSGVQYAYLDQATYTKNIFVASRAFWLQKAGRASCTTDLDSVLPACAFFDRWDIGIGFYPHQSIVHPMPPIQLAEETSGSGSFNRGMTLILARVASYEYLAQIFVFLASNEADQRSSFMYASADSLLEALRQSLNPIPGHRAPTYAVKLFREFSPVFAYIAANSGQYSDDALAELKMRLHTECTAITNTGVAWDSVPVCLSPNRGW